MKLIKAQIPQSIKEVVDWWTNAWHFL